MGDNGASNQAEVQNKSTATFTAALIINGAVAAVEIAAFAILFKRFRKIYEPRTYLVKKDKQPNEPMPHGLFAWLPHIIRMPAEQIIYKNGLDAYQYVRFLWLMVMIFFPFWIISWIILFPVNAANSGGGREGIEIFTFGNVGLSSTQQKRYAAHIILLYVFTFYVFYLIKREMDAFVKRRHEYISSPEHAALPQSKTVLVTGVPRDLLSQEALRHFLRFMPGGVNRIWLSRDLGKQMPELYERRQKAATKLEAAETKLAKTAIKLRSKAEKAQSKNKKGATGPLQVDSEKRELPGDQLVPRKQRPTHKLGFLGLIGKKVDTLEWAKEEYAQTDKELNDLRSNLDAYKPNGSVFIQFNNQIAAHMFQQCLQHHLPLRMSGRFTDCAPEDVIWSNLSINPFQAKARFAISWAITIGLIILWAFPVAFVSLISNVSYLCVEVSWLAWLCTLPGPVNGIIQGILPPVALAVLFMLVPIIFRLLATFEGIPMRQLVELSLMKRYFIFLVIHGFLIVTAASGLVAALPEIASNPGSAVTLLAQQLPSASTFFLTFLTVQLLAGPAGALLQIAPLVLYYVFLILLGSTPRKVFNIKYKMKSVQFGTVWPNISLVMVIGIGYSIIAPMINAFAAVGFALSWFVYKYLFTYVFEQPQSGETSGLFYPMAIQQIFVGLYIQQLCLTGLFFLARDADGGVSAIPEAVFAIILIVITAAFHIVLNSGAYPLIRNLPLSLAGDIDTKSPQLNGNGNGNGYHGDTKPRNDDYEMSAIRGSSSTDRRAQPTRQLTREENRSGANAFNEPPAYEEAPVVWLARDGLGIGAAEVEDMQAKGVQASLQGAEMNEKGKVDVSRSPPDEEWIAPEGEEDYTSSPTATKTGNGFRDAGDAPRRYSVEPETAAPTRYEDIELGNTAQGPNGTVPRSKPMNF